MPIWLAGRIYKMKLKLALCLALLISLSILYTPIYAQQPQTNYTIEMKVAPEQPLSNRWCFVVDNSHSIRGVAEKANAAFLECIKARTDQLEYSIVVFNNQGMDRFRDWQWASESSFEDAFNWVKNDPHNGVLSYATTALETALKQERDELTVIIISDGGFTEVSKSGGSWEIIRDTIRRSQLWRYDNGLSQALITTIGIHNPVYRAGNKPPDEECQGFLREIGQVYRGGYFFVRSTQ